MFRYEYMVIAFVVALLLGLAFPLLGQTAVYKRLSSSGDALAHSALAGVAIGLASGLNPLYISIISCVVSFVIIDILRRKFGKHAEIGVVVILSAAIALTGVLSGYVSATNFDAYLFGDILLIKRDELWVVLGLTLIVVAFFLLTFFHQFSSLYSEEESKIQGIPVGALNLIHSILFALTVAIGAKMVGSLIVSSMLVLPTASALLLKKGYRFTTIAGIVYSMAAMGLGIVVSYYLDWRSGATSVGIAVALLLLTLVYRGIVRLASRRKKKPSFE